MYNVIGDLVHSLISCVPLHRLSVAYIACNIFLHLLIILTPLAHFSSSSIFFFFFFPASTLSSLSLLSPPPFRSLFSHSFSISSLQLSLLTKYGLGTKRTLDQFMEFTGVDIRANVIFGDRCKQLHSVPFVKDKGKIENR